MKRILPIIVVVILLFTSIASAAVLSVSASASLSFTGTTANCGASASEYGKSISAIMDLYENGTVVRSWAKSGTSSVSFDETYGAVSGRSYYVRIHGLSGGTTFDKSSAVKVCP